jgi:glycosyltransferase involved in cell wall biosynthesis
MAAKRIAYLMPLYFDERSYLGGGERYPLNVARGVIAAGNGEYHVELISYGPSARRETLQPGLTLRVLPASNRPADKLDVVSWELPAALAEADLVHIHQAFTRSSEAGLLAAKQQGKPVCVTDHGGNSSTLGMYLDTLSLVDLVVCYSRFGASLLQTTTPLVVIPGGVDAARFAPPAERPPRDRILFVGRLLPHKGVDVLITALPPDLPLTVCGRAYDDRYFRHLKDLARGKHIEFVTDADDDMIRGLYARARVNVLPSVYRDCYGNTHRAPELMGLTLLEAMACGTPVVCSRVGAMPEFVRDGETGFVFDTPDQLTRHLRHLASHPEVVERMGRQCRDAVLRDYDLKVVGEKLVPVYERLLRRRQGVAA